MEVNVMNLDRNFSPFLCGLTFCFHALRRVQKSRAGDASDAVFYVNRHGIFRLCARWDCSYFAERLSLPERERPPRVLLLCIGTGLEIRLPFASFTTGRTCSGRRQSLLPS